MEMMVKAGFQKVFAGIETPIMAGVPASNLSGALAQITRPGETRLETM